MYVGLLDLLMGFKVEESYLFLVVNYQIYLLFLFLEFNKNITLSNIIFTRDLTLAVDFIHMVDMIFCIFYMLYKYVYIHCCNVLYKCFGLIRVLSRLSSHLVILLLHFFLQEENDYVLTSYILCRICQIHVHFVIHIC